MTPQRQHFVVFYSPGTFFAEQTDRPVTEWNPTEATALAASVSERYGAAPYGFRFETRIVADPIPDGEGGALKVESRTVEQSGTYFLRARLETFDTIEARASSSEDILRDNMRCNGWPIVVVCDEAGGHRWKSVQPFTETDFVVDAAGLIVKRGDDPVHVAYRRKMLAEFAVR